MIRLVVRSLIVLVLCVAIFEGCYWLMSFGDTDSDVALVLAMLAMMPWTWALGVWAMMPPRVEPTYFAPMSTREPTRIEIGDHLISGRAPRD